MIENEIKDIDKIVEYIKERLHLSDNSDVTKEPLPNKIWTPITADLVIKDNLRLFFIEIRSKPRLDSIFRLVTLREILEKQKEDDSEYNFVIGCKVIPPKVKDLAELLEIKIIELPKNLRISIPQYDIFPYRLKVSSEKSWKVISNLLKEKESSIRHISKKAKVSYAWTYETIQHLINQDIVERKENYVEIINTDKLLNGIAWERPFNNLKKDEIFIEYNKTHEAAREISSILPQKNIKFAFTCFTAGGLYTGTAIRTDSVYLYLLKEDIEFFKEIFDTSKKDGIKALIYLPDRDVFSDTRSLEKVKVVSPSQTLLDLAGLGYGGRDLALDMVKKYGSL